jgi:very-short-patch-repair endonuclease
MAPIDRSIERLARRQHGAFSGAQLVDLGATRAATRSRVGAGVWRREARGVFTHTAFPRTYDQRLMCAGLWHPAASVCGLPACAAHDLAGFAPCEPEINVPVGANHRCPLATVHRRIDVATTTVRGIPMVTACQALFDVAGVVPFRRLRRAADLALAAGLFDIDELGERYLALAPNRPHGVGAMRSIVEEFGREGYEPPRSVLEAELSDLLELLGIPYVRQASFPWRLPHTMNVDIFIPSWHLIAEADGRRWHTRVRQLEIDLERDNEAAAHGIHVMRFTHDVLVRRRRRAISWLETYRSTYNLEAA